MITMRPGDQGPAAGDESAAEAAARATSAEMRAEFLDFYDRERDYVVRFMINCGASVEDAQDAAQEAFVDAWTHNVLPDKWADVNNPRGWIRVVALKKYQRLYGRRPQVPTVPVSDLSDTPQPASNHADLIPGTLLVLDALRSLDPELRAILAFHLDGFSGPEIAEQLNLTEQKVRDLLKKARKILAIKLRRDQ
jgi:RNA polymerase sigma factor (sigma-70 family)